MLFELSAGPVGLEGTSWPRATPFDPSAGLDGFEEESRLGCLWYESALETAVLGEVEETETAMGVCGAVEIARRTEDENMPLQVGKSVLGTLARECCLV